MKVLNVDTIAPLMASGVKTVADLIALDRAAIHSLPFPFDQRVQVLVARNEALGRFDKTFEPFKTPMDSHSDAEMVLALMDYREEALAAAKQLEKKTLFNSLVVTTIDVALAIYDNMGFYAGKRRIDLGESPAAAMAGNKGIIRLWEMAEKDPLSLVDSINDEKRINVLSIVHGILEIFLNTMIGNYDLGRTLIDGKEPITYSIEEIKNSKTDDEKTAACALARKTFEETGLFLKVRQMQLALKEHEAYDKNPAWEHLVYESDVNGPFDGRKARQRCSKELHLHAEKYPNSLRRLSAVSSALKEVDREYVTAFYMAISDLSPELMELMTMPLAVSFKDEATEIVWEDPLMRGVECVSLWLLEEWKRFCSNMMEYLDERIDSSSEDGEAKILWAEAFAQFLACREGSIFWFQFTKDDVRKFIKLANSAARRDWIDRRVMRRANKMKSSSMTNVSSQVQVVETVSAERIENMVRQGFENLMRNRIEAPKRKSRKRGTPGRKKSDIKEEQVAEGIKWLKNNAGKNPMDAAKHILDKLKLVRPRWKNGGYEGKSACASLAQAIRRCRDAAAESID